MYKAEFTHSYIKIILRCFVFYHILRKITCYTMTLLRDIYMITKHTLHNMTYCSITMSVRGSIVQTGITWKTIQRRIINTIVKWCYIPSENMTQNWPPCGQCPVCVQRLVAWPQHPLTWPSTTPHLHLVTSQHYNDQTTDLTDVHRRLLHGTLCFL